MENNLKNLGIKEFEWGIIGGGISGIAISEILSREGHSNVLIDKDPKLASETTREFHEWIHTGALYTLIPDKLKTLKFILGAVDDLIEYYSAFERMNLEPTNRGLKINSNKSRGWFNSNYIHFKYRVKNRKITFPWLIGLSRSIRLINKIEEHDWLRRRAGELEPFKKDYLKEILIELKKIISFNEKFFLKKTPDFTTNSRILLRDLVSTSIQNGMELSLNNPIKKIKKTDNGYLVSGEKENFLVQKIAVCAGKGVEEFSDTKIKTSYAPIAVVDGLKDDAISFVELDYFPKKCINMLTKEDGIGLVGGISLNKIEDCEKYLDFVISEHKKQEPNIKVIDRYIGEKNEIIFKGENRNYLYHIHEDESNKNIWSIIPGKFTLAFSLAPEFYRRVYKKNPRKSFKTCKHDEGDKNIVSNTFWEDSINKT